MRLFRESGRPIAASAAGIAIVAAGLLGFVPQAASAADSPTSPAVSTEPETLPVPNDGEQVRFGSDLEDSILIGTVGEDPDDPATVGTRSIPLNPIDVQQCLLANNANHLIIDDMFTYAYNNGPEIYWPGGDVDLLCGTENTSGFKHIRARHQWDVGGINSWEDVRASASAALGYTSPQTWDEYMIHAVHDTLDYSYPSPQTIPGDKVCFAAPFHIWVGDRIYASYYANTIVSKTNFIVVTAYLSNNSQASACRQEG